jgi:rare lipoprotein A
VINYLNPRIIGLAVLLLLCSLTLSIMSCGLSSYTSSEYFDKTQRVFYGLASYYASSLTGRKTASGAIYQPSRLTAAHRSLPFGTRLRVTNLINQKKVLVTVNDRGPFVRGRVLDLSKRAAVELGIINRGVAKVRAEIL